MRFAVVTRALGTCTKYRASRYGPRGTVGQMPLLAGNCYCTTVDASARSPAASGMWEGVQGGILRVNEEGEDYWGKQSVRGITRVYAWR